MKIDLTVAVVAVALFTVLGTAWVASIWAWLSDRRDQRRFLSGQLSASPESRWGAAELRAAGCAWADSAMSEDEPPGMHMHLRPLRAEVDLGQDLADLSRRRKAPSSSIDDRGRQQVSDP